MGAKKKKAKKKQKNLREIKKANNDFSSNRFYNWK